MDTNTNNPKQKHEFFIFDIFHADYLLSKFKIFCEQHELAFVACTEIRGD